MSTTFLLYGASGYVGAGAARLAVELGLTPVLAGRSEAKVAPLARELGLEYRVFSLDDSAALDSALDGMAAVLHLAGPYLYTARQMVDACLRAGAHYLDINGEIPVLQEMAERDAEAKSRGIMLLPAVGFDVVPTDCLAVHLRNRLPSATRLAIAFRSEGVGSAPPGTQRTAIELARFGDRVRRAGELVVPEPGAVTRTIDFGTGPVEVTRLTWGDVFTAYFSTGIPNIEVFAAIPPGMKRQVAIMQALKPVLAFAPARRLLALGVRPPPGPAVRSQSTTHVWGEVADEDGNIAISRIHGPEAGFEWTIRASMTVLRRVLDGDATPGFQTPARVYGPDLVLEVTGVTREDVV